MNGSVSHAFRSPAGTVSMWAMSQTVPFTLPFFFARILERGMPDGPKGTSTLSTESKPFRRVIR